jgi:hypothetical protein
LPQDRGQERRFLNRRARAGACCVSRVAAHPSLCNVALLVQASAIRGAERRPLQSGRRMAMRGPQHVFVLVLSSGFRCMHVLPIAFVTQAAFRYRPNYLTNKARGRVINYVQNPPKLSLHARCFFVFFLLLPRNATGRPMRRTATPLPLRRAVLRAPSSR